MGFRDDQVPGDTESISIGTPGHRQYRVFNDKTRPLRAEAEQVARDFCERKGMEMNLLQTTAFIPREEPWYEVALELLCLLCYADPPPAVEVFFECLEKPNASSSPPQVDAR